MSLVQTQQPGASLETAETAQSPDRLQAKLDEFARLERGWDGDDAEPIPASTIQAARQLLGDLLREQSSLREPVILPTFDGSIQLEWHDRDRTLEMSFTGEKWIAVGVELSSEQPARQHTISFAGTEGGSVASKCYEWFVRRDTGRAGWPSR